MRRDIEFNATDGITLRGWHYTPDGGGMRPTIVMAHGFAAVKEMYLDAFGEAFAEAGFASVIYDNRNFGASDGLPRQEIDPWRQIRDYCDAITFARGLPGTDPDRIGIWGSSYSGGHVLVVAAIDKRVKCVVSQVPAVSGWENFRRLVRADVLGALEGLFAEDRQARAAGAAPMTLPVVAEDPMASSALPTADSWKFFSQAQAARAPAWRNEVTVRSLEYGFGYEPGAYIGRISPSPLLMIVALDDCVAVTDLAIKAYGNAFEPKKLVLLPGGHFDPYEEKFGPASSAAIDWFTTHLGG